MLTLADICASVSDDPIRDMDAHLLVLWTIARMLPAYRAIEIGVDDGSSTMPLLLGVAAVGGSLVSIDCVPCPTAVERVAQSGFAGHWQFTDIGSEAAAPLLSDGINDLVMIDGDHSYEGVSRDWHLYAPKVRVGGLVLFHDKCNVQDFPGIARLIDEEIRPDPAFEQMTLPWGWGLTICRRLA